MSGSRRCRFGALALVGLGLGLATGAGRLRAESLLPLEGERFRAQYGQEALFRLRLGVDAALAPDPTTEATEPVSCPVPDWEASPEQRQYSQALEQRRYFEAGKELGHWQRRLSLCAPR